MLCKMPPTSISVIEMGMSTPHREIQRLCAICPPSISIVLNILPVHIEHLGSLDAIAEAKGEIVDSLLPDGWAILNVDDLRVFALRSKTVNVLTFGLGKNADVWADEIHVNNEVTYFSLVTPTYRRKISLRLRGSHNILNSLAAAAAAYILEIPAALIAGAIGDFLGVPQRGEIINLRESICIVDDTYNSNPVSLNMAVNNLVSMRNSNGRLILLTGDMLELGEDQANIHADMGKVIGSSSVDLVLGVGLLSRYLVDEFVAVSGRVGVSFKNNDQALAFLVGTLQSGDIVLIKGSRGAQLDYIVSAMVSVYGLANAKD
jgi:UDP-N-acetylmuramoyl-tripeptide--D-alanyl-D-alanine ligase